MSKKELVLKILAKGGEHEAMYNEINKVYTKKKASEKIVFIKTMNKTKAAERITQKQVLNIIKHNKKDEKKAMDLINKGGILILAYCTIKKEGNK